MKTADAVLLTDRLRLERPVAGDADLMLAIWNDPAFVRHVGDRGIRTLDEAAEAMREGVLKQWDDSGFGCYRVSLLDGTGPVGICGLFKRPNLEDPDIGYALLPEFCGQGYALEAAQAVRDHARDGLKLPCVKAIVSPGHARSIRLLEKLGMRYERPIRMPDEDEDILLYGMDFQE